MHGNTCSVTVWGMLDAVVLTAVLTRPVVPAVCRRVDRIVCVSKRDRKVRLFVDGKLKVFADARFGAASTPTREGRFSVTWKSRYEVSTLYGSEMPFSLFFSGGQAIHYSSDFAARGYAGASHGCVNLRSWDKAKKLFYLVPTGTPVYVY